MGVCVSVYRDSSFGSKQGDKNNKKQQQILIPTSPTKLINNNKPNGIAQWPPISQSSAPFPDLGSKDESFFDSQAWLDSDCEDDFMSVKGDFTPSAGNTPVHHHFSAGTPKVNGALLVDQTTPVALSEPSPNTRNKRLSDLFNDSLRVNQDADNEQEDKMSNTQNEMSGKLGTPCASEVNSVSSDGKRTPHGEFKPVREKSVKSTVQWCLPNMLSSCSSYTERKKKMSHPTPISGVN